MDDAAFSQLVNEVRNRHNISEVVSKWTSLKRSGRELVGLCLNHKERSPSMRVSDAKGVVFCFACGFTADIFGVVMHMQGLRFMDALRWVDSSELMVVDPSERVRKRAEDEAERRASLADARRFWSDASPIEGSAGETYLCQHRGITMPLPASIRFGRVPSWKDDATGKWGPCAPAVLCAVFDGAGEVCGIQRIFVRDDGSGKRWGAKSKRSLGSIREASMRFGPPQRTVIVCEGPEDGLTLAQEIPGSSVWPACGTGLMPLIDYPPEVQEVIIAGQNNEAGRIAVDRTAEAVIGRGLPARTMFPDADFDDWNDQLLGVCK
jgi:DNA primase